MGGPLTVMKIAHLDWIQNQYLFMLWLYRICDTWKTGIKGNARSLHDCLIPLWSCVFSVFRGLGCSAAWCCWSPLPKAERRTRVQSLGGESPWWACGGLPAFCALEVHDQNLAGLAIHAGLEWDRSSGSQAPPHVPLIPAGFLSLLVLGDLSLFPHSPGWWSRTNSTCPKKLPIKNFLDMNWQIFRLWCPESTQKLAKSTAEDFFYPGPALKGLSGMY